MLIPVICHLQKKQQQIVVLYLTLQTFGEISMLQDLHSDSNLWIPTA